MLKLSIHVAAVCLWGDLTDLLNWPNLLKSLANGYLPEWLNLG